MRLFSGKQSMEDTRQYLRNLIVLARADGAIHPREVAVLERVSAEIGASPQELQSVRNELGEPQLEWAGLPRLSTRIRNLEDMVEVALADQQLSENERLFLIRAALEIGLSQEQANGVLREVAERVARRHGART